MKTLGRSSLHSKGKTFGKPCKKPFPHTREWTRQTRQILRSERDGFRIENEVKKRQIGKKLAKTKQKRLHPTAASSWRRTNWSFREKKKRKPLVTAFDLNPTGWEQRGEKRRTRRSKNKIRPVAKDSEAKQQVFPVSSNSGNNKVKLDTPNRWTHMGHEKQHHNVRVDAPKTR
jgi:hypothetical protein